MTRNRIFTPRSRNCISTL